MCHARLVHEDGARGLKPVLLFFLFFPFLFFFSKYVFNVYTVQVPLARIHINASSILATRQDSRKGQLISRSCKRKSPTLEQCTIAACLVGLSFLEGLRPCVGATCISLLGSKINECHSLIHVFVAWVCLGHAWVFVAWKS